MLYADTYGFTLTLVASYPLKKNASAPPLPPPTPGPQPGLDHLCGCHGPGECAALSQHCCKYDATDGAIWCQAKQGRDRSFTLLRQVTRDLLLGTYCLPHALTRTMTDDTTHL